MFWFKYGISAVIVCAAIYGIYWFVTRPAASAPPKLVAVKRGTLMEAASLSGKVQANVTVEVKSRASGTVIEVAVGTGSKVKAGDLLVKLDPQDEQRAVKQATVNLNAAKSRQAQSEASLRISKLQTKEAEAKRDARVIARKNGSITEEELRAAISDAEAAAGTVELREAEVTAAKTAVEGAQLSLDDSNRRLEETTIIAPISGTVLSMNVQRGLIVSSPISNVGGGNSLVVLGDTSVLHVLGALDEADVGRVKQMQEVQIRVDAYSDMTFEGKVALISPLGRETSNVVTFDLDVVVTDKRANLLLPGMSADLQVITNKVENTLLVPVAAVRAEGGAQTVQTADGEQKKVKLGPTDGTNYAVTEGLKEGEEIVANNTKAPETQQRSFSLFGGGGRR
jgi:HlyD family secretion protein